MDDYETLKKIDNLFFQKKKEDNEYRIVSSKSLPNSTNFINLINIVRNNALFDLIHKLNTDLIVEHTNKNNIVKYVISTDDMREFGDKYAIKFTNNVNIISDNTCSINGASVPYSSEIYSDIFYLNNFNIIFSNSNDEFNTILTFIIDSNVFNDAEIEILSKFFINIVIKLNLYVSNL
jgi:hypothetical protein